MLLRPPVQFTARYCTAIAFPERHRHCGKCARVSFTQQLYLTLQVGRSTTVADGNDAIMYPLSVRDAAGQPVKDRAVQWVTDPGILSTSAGHNQCTG